MKILGSIVSKRKIKDVVGFVEVVNDISKVSDPTKPILIVGLSEAKKLISNFSILEKSVGGDIFWTYGRTEKRDEHEFDLKSLYDYVLESAIKDIKYYYVNLFTIKLNSVKKLINILNNGDKKYIYISNNIFYVYYNNYILGVSLDITSWLNISKKKILSKLHSNPNNIISYSDAFLSYDIKRIINNKKYVTPYFMSIQSE